MSKYNTIHLTIKKVRESKKITREEIAKTLEIKYDAYGKIERGETVMTLDKLERIAYGLGLMISDLLDKHLGIEDYRGNVTYIPIKNHNTNLVTSLNRYHNAETSIICNIPLFKGSKLYMVDVEDNSMLPTIGKGDQIIIDRVENYNDIEEGIIYLIETDKKRYLRRVYKSEDNDSFILKTDNNLIPKCDLNTDSIVSIWKIMGCFTQETTPKLMF